MPSQPMCKQRKMVKGKNCKCIRQFSTQPQFTTVRVEYFTQKKISLKLAHFSEKKILLLTMPFCAFCQDEEAEHTDKTCPDLKCKICGANGHIFRHCPQKNQAYVLPTPVEVPKFTAATTSERKAPGKTSIDLQDGFYLVLVLFRGDFRRE